MSYAGSIPASPHLADTAGYTSHNAGERLHTCVSQCKAKSLHADTLIFNDAPQASYSWTKVWRTKIRLKNACKHKRLDYNTLHTSCTFCAEKRPLPAGKSRYFEWQMPCSYPLITMITSRKDGFPGRKKPCFTQRFAMFHPAKGHQPHSRQASYASTDSCFGKTGEHCQDDTLPCTIPTSFHDDTNANARQCKQEAW